MIHTLPVTDAYVNAWNATPRKPVREWRYRVNGRTPMRITTSEGRIPSSQLDGLNTGLGSCFGKPFS